MGAHKLSEVRDEAGLIREISQIVSEITGVQLGEKQFSLVQGRLTKRYRDLKLNQPVEYARYLSDNLAVETGILVSLLTTHHTYFFREFSQFEFLLKSTLPRLIAEKSAQGANKIRIWSAACSRGQEVYSLAMFLQHHLPQMAPSGFTFEIVGSDVCEESVGIAKNGVYAWDELKTVPTVYLQGHWMRGTGDIADFVRVKDSLRSKVRFQTGNLIELGRPNTSVPRDQKFDIIFCRNVFIYFTREQTAAITREFLERLSPGGQVFIGLSESLNGLELPVEWIGPSVYEPRGVHKLAAVPNQTKQTAIPQAKSVTATGPQGAVAPLQTQTPAKKIRVLCVDDSPTVLTLLKKIFQQAPNCEVVGTAANGKEASEKARQLKPDIITLDIHMPEVTGVGYMEKFHPSIGIPVVMVSSVSRDDSKLALRALELGASDYIEKPSIGNLAQVQEELLFKIQTAIDLAPNRKPALSSLDANPRKTLGLVKTDGMVRVIFASFAARESVLGLVKSMRAPQPPTLVCFSETGEIYPEWVKTAATQVTGGQADLPASASGLQSGKVYFCSIDKNASLVRSVTESLRSSGLVVGPAGKELIKFVRGLNKIDLIVEEVPRGVSRDLSSKASRVIPLTSFLYESDRYLAGETPRAGEKK